MSLNIGIPVGRAFLCHGSRCIGAAVVLIVVDMIEGGMV
jgi:hypothetical protein